MTAQLAALGWPFAIVSLAAAAVLRARLERVARAEHELRGPATVLCMACERLRSDPAAQGHAEALEAELARLRAGLADLTAARTGKRRPLAPQPLELERLARSALAGWRPALDAAERTARVSWRAGRPRVTADPGRLAQALGNLVANAAEHGEGPVELRSDRTTGGVRVEVRNARPATRQVGRRNDRGRGLAIASRAAESVGGHLELVPSPDEVVAAIELPVEEGEPEPDAA